MDPSAIQYFVQAGFAGLFIWLLFDTRRDNKEREKRADERENRLTELLTLERDLRNTLYTTVTEMGTTLERIDGSLSRINDALRLSSRSAAKHDGST